MRGRAGEDRVAAEPPAITRRGPERAAAWMITGPLGHLYGTVADMAAFSARLTARQLGRRLADPRGRNRD